jgi:cytochrome c oxidase subunit 2
MGTFLSRFMPPDASAHGPELDRITAYVHILMLVLFVGWAAYFVYAVWRFRAKRNPVPAYEGLRSHWSAGVEAGVAVVEVLLLVGLSIPAWSRWSNAPKPGSNPLVIHVVAEQFAWNIHYPGPDNVFGRRDVKFVTAMNPLGLDRSDPAGKDDFNALNELHVELNRPVIVHVTSKDVIHSFFLPVMRVKQDAIPGMDVPIHFTPVAGNHGQQWDVACAQLCGLGHYRMRGMLFVDSHADFVDWMTMMSEDAAAAAAEEQASS